MVASTRKRGGKPRDLRLEIGVADVEGYFLVTSPWVSKAVGVIVWLNSEGGRVASSEELKVKSPSPKKRIDWGELVRRRIWAIVGICCSASTVPVQFCKH